MDSETEKEECTTSIFPQPDIDEVASLSKNYDNEEDMKCGIGPCKFGWMQKFASKKAYVLVYGLVGMTHLAISAYFVGIISTLEKRFRIPSSFIGMISSSVDVGIILTTLSVTYLGKRSHKPRWVAYGTFLVALACFIRLLPHWIDQRTIELHSETPQINTTLLCDSSKAENENCGKDGSQSGNASAYVFLLAGFVQGLGCSIYYTLGMAYLDDNAKKSKGAVLIVISTVFTMLGSSVGFVLASFSLNFYVDPGHTPDFGTTDPRWIGAWWLGWIPMGAMTFLFGIMMYMFPRTLPRTLQRKREAAVAAGHSYVPEEIPEPSFKDFKATMTRLLKNKILMCNNISSTFIGFGYYGQWLFMPKYMETQFNLSAAAANLTTGSIGLLFTAAGLLVSAFVIFKFKPNARSLAAWNVISELIDVVGFLSILTISCESLNFKWTDLSDGSKSFDIPCNADCACHNAEFSPVCHVPTKESFFSPCHAGCHQSYLSQNGTKVFSDCSCTLNESLVLDGPCALDCKSALVIFVVVHCVQRFLGATGRAGNCLIQFRCVDVADKALSFALLEALLCIFVFIPCPVLFGHLIDLACSVWQMECGETGNCWIYDAEKLRFYVYLPILGCLIMGTLFDIGVWYYAKGLPMYEEDETHSDGEKLENLEGRDRKSRFKALTIVFSGGT